MSRTTTFGEDPSTLGTRKETLEEARVVKGVFLPHFVLQ